MRASARQDPILDTARVLIAARGSMPRIDRVKLRAIKKQLAAKNRFNSWGGADIADDARVFGKAMQRYLNRYNAGKPGWTCGEVLDVLISLGYVNPERDFEVCVHRLTTAVAYFKDGGTFKQGGKRGGRRKERRPFPTWSEVLAIAKTQGWHLPEGAAHAGPDAQEKRKHHHQQRHHHHRR